MDGRRLAALAVSMIVLVGCRGAAAPSAAAGPVLADIGAGPQGAAGLEEVDGIALSPDGRVWLGISAPSDHAAGTSEYSAAVVSFLPDGTDLRVEASGIRAPVGLAFYPGTSDLFVTMNQRDDLGEQTPGDWLAMVQAGDKWGFPDCYGQGGSVCSGVPSPTADLDRHAAVSGVAIVTGQLGSTIGTAGGGAEWASGKG